MPRSLKSYIFIFKGFKYLFVIIKEICITYVKFSLMRCRNIGGTNMPDNCRLTIDAITIMLLKN